MLCDVILRCKEAGCLVTGTAALSVVMCDRGGVCVCVDEWPGVLMGTVIGWDGVGFSGVANTMGPTAATTNDSGAVVDRH
jgi:hypothetical protein